MSKFFINRPIVAMVISIVMVLVGSLTVLSLPVAQFPNITPPEIQVIATYVGADAQTLEQAVATPIEQQMNGVDNENYMYSLNATGNSSTSLIVDVDVKTDPNTDFILTQSRETQAASQLPSDVNNYGITVRKSVTAPLMWVALYSPHGTYDAKFLANYAYINIVDPILRSYGIGNVQVFGAGQYAMRLWVKPDTLAKLGVTVPEIVSAIQAQNTVNPAGKAGGEPAPKGQEFTYSVLAQGRLISPEEFGQIVVRETPDGGTVRVRDVARIELGAQDYSVAGRFNGKPSAIIATYQLPGSNAVDAAAAVNKLMAKMRERFPEDLDYVVALDTTRSVTEGMKEIVVTLLIALALVILVVFLFLQSWRATLIPLLAVPVSLVGTFVLFPLFGFSINTLSLFGLVLAIGLVVDDAIVVVEGVERHIEEGMTPKAAALKAMEELSGPVVGIALVLSAVFVPTAFIPGITGKLYQQFAVTIAISVLLSAFNALTLSPALAALLLKPRTPSRGLLRRFFDWFNRVFERATEGYVRWSAVLLQKTVVVVALLAAFGIAGFFFANRIPSSFLPDEDQGYAYVNVQLPNGASLERTTAVTADVEEILMNTPGVERVTSFVGFSLLSFVRTSYNSTFFVTLKPWDERKTRAEQFQSFKANLNQKLSKLPAAVAFAFSPPAIPGVGTAGGFTFILEDRSGSDIQFRAKSENVGQFYVRNNKGENVPLSTLTTIKPRLGPEFTLRFNEYRSAQINGSAAPGFSADQATAALEDVFKQTMPREMGFDYSGISFQEQKAREGVPPAAIFGLSLLFVFLVLAALYESWTLPFSVLLSTPVAIFGAFAVLWLRRVLLNVFLPPYLVQIETDIYSQIGLVMLIGLAAKNAILIVEFAKDEYEQGKPLADAALEGARLRLRPILMTSFAFILGCVPLWTASGAGSVARQIMGTTVIGGMMAASLIGIFFVPAIFYLVEKWSGAGKEQTSPALPPSPAPATGD